MINSIKRRLADFLTWHTVLPLSNQIQETIYQSIFNQQCATLGIRNDFYPVGAAANYSLMYLLARTLSEQQPGSIVEFGSGQSTMLIDRIRSAAGTHLCVEHDSQWHSLFSQRLTRCEYIHRPLTSSRNLGRCYDFYADIPPRPFDLLLVDGPIGVDEFSRFGCVNYALENAKPDFLIVVDDHHRPGEKQTVQVLFETLRRTRPDLRMRELQAARSQAVIASGRYLQTLYYW